MNTRSFIIERAPEGESDLKAQIREEMIQKLASEWNDVHNAMEARQFRSDEEREDEDEYHSDRAAEIGYDAKQAAEEAGLSPEECTAAWHKAEDDYLADVRAKERESLVRMDVIEELLGELGARMMRPYEHWNEDERYMEYMETRYDNEY